MESYKIFDYEDEQDWLTGRKNGIGEVEQPESAYVFRISEDGKGTPMFKLVEADGGLWKNAAIKKIKEYLEYELAKELEHLHITIIA